MSPRPWRPSGTNVGVNGVAVVKTGDTYLCYMAVSYHNFSIRCYDVTDPENIVLYTDFAQNGVCQTAYTPFYLATDTQGNVYADRLGEFRVLRDENRAGRHSAQAD